jgi:hypothetical protein
VFIEAINVVISFSFVLTCLLGHVAVILFSLGCTVCSFCVGVHVIAVPLLFIVALAAKYHQPVARLPT